jgi:hypothetical protein
MSDPLGSSSGLNYGIITFAGSVVPSTHLLRFNGAATDLTTSGRLFVGNSFIVGVPMRLFRLTCRQETNADVDLRILKDDSPNVIPVATTFHDQELGANFLLTPGNRLQVNVTHALGSSLPRLLVSLYFFALPEYVDRLILPAVNILTFAGNSTVVNRQLRYNGDVSRDPMANLNDSENYCVIGSNMVIYRLTWHKNENTNIRITLGGTAPTTTLEAIGEYGVLDFTPYAVNTGDVVWVNCLTDPRSCLISLYATPV